VTTNKKSSGPAQKAIGDVAPKLAELTDNVLFGDASERPKLGKRDRSLHHVRYAGGLREEGESLIPTGFGHGIANPCDFAPLSGLATDAAFGFFVDRG